MLPSLASHLFSLSKCTSKKAMLYVELKETRWYIWSFVHQRACNTSERIVSVLPTPHSSPARPEAVSYCGHERSLLDISIRDGRRHLIRISQYKSSKGTCGRWAALYCLCSAFQNCCHDSSCWFFLANFIVFMKGQSCSLAEFVINKCHLRIKCFGEKNNLK